jgi:hypothetical protein
MERFVNLTPQRVTIVSSEGVEYEFQSEGIASVSETGTPVMRVHAGIEIREPQYGEVVGLPEPRTGVVYIVSTAVRERLPQRTDLASPDLRETARDTMRGTGWFPSLLLAIQMACVRKGRYIEFA